MSDKERELIEFLRVQAEQWAWCFPGCLDYLNNFKATELARWQCTSIGGKRNDQVPSWAGLP